jgi:hypothetical protein
VSRSKRLGVVGHATPSFVGHRSVAIQPHMFI